ncbi:MAG: N(4)-(beta-N-acetylglucosaminyl)-L-asparaginase [Melioribacteraceae bacterium]|nr:N(4)-(beta-N-acetylglucosaminyl)-L-asparaginase [Melioribacteraceae bacterium]MCF8355557.1 N(4)-(beta-N-acetylglucosaminyl)-L-asparaginase [Melioribacteraceae bacterium]MCF8394232.1 N(4)-(beta-N-acetylglucosaminyl)-L-asparaginase [Melioribacteraceae bacterium]MCF8419953.1 N(4)-(beta-N-acetylglucosaminyl)-L-asparaginase [Melioribacteraceae bacterium]
MKQTRRKFIKSGIVLSSGIALSNSTAASILSTKAKDQKSSFPIAISTWSHGVPATKAAYDYLSNGKNILDAIETGIHTAESNPEIMSVGYGGFPDAEGNVTLDASIMDKNGNAGSVAYLKNIKHPISVARLVMEKTDHVMLVGEGAKQFALSHGFKEENLLSDAAKADWLRWKHEQEIDSSENHDTIGLLAIDKDGNISGGVSTSGAAYKLPGRVGDSPIIGAALYVDNEIGAACATGLGELVMESVSSFLVVEKMREGYSPTEACEIAIQRIYKRIENKENKNQVGLIAINKNGEYGGFSLSKGFDFGIANSSENRLLKTDHL